MIHNKFVNHIKSMLLLGEKTINNRPLLDKETGQTNTKGQQSIVMDIELEKIFIDYIKNNNIPADIYSEECGLAKFHKNPKYMIVFDPLDGSTNYRVGKGILPFGHIIAIYKGLNPRFSDIVTAGAIECTKNLGWIYDGKKTYDLTGNLVKLKQDWPVNKSTPIYLDLHAGQDYKVYTPLYKNLSIRNHGSTVGNLTYVLANVASAVGLVHMSAEEIGAVVALIKGAGGIVVNHKGKDIFNEYFSPDKKMEFLGGCPNIVEFIVKKLSTV